MPSGGCFVCEADVEAVEFYDFPIDKVDDVTVVGTPELLSAASTTLSNG